MNARRFRFRLRFIVADEYQPLRVVPWFLWIALLALAAAQVAVIKESPPPRARAQDLRPPPPPIALAMAAAGDPATLGKALMLRLQAFDNQPGISIPFRDLDYGAVGEWLDAIVSLDERAQYPHFSAANIYAIVNEKERQRQMVIWVRDQFVKNPTTRWEAMSRAAVVAHHYIKDIPLSLEIARLLRENLKIGEAPNWVLQMEAFFAANDGEYEAAARILWNLIEAGAVTTPEEFQLMHERLVEFVDKMVKDGKIKSEPELRAKIDELDALRDRFVRQYE